VPVVSTDAGGAAETISQGLTGFVVHSIEPNILADRILKILDDPAWRAKASLEGPAFVERRFGMPRMIAETLQLYKIPQR
jgi:phosphatidylinositol alpha-1,6-mannosyltransferase